MVLLYLHDVKRSPGNRILRVNICFVCDFSFHDDAVARTVDHIERFWAPSMQKSLVAYVDEGGGGLKPGTLDAVRKLAGG